MHHTAYIYLERERERERERDAAHTDVQSVAARQIVGTLAKRTGWGLAFRV